MKIRSVTVFNGAPEARSKEEIARSGRAALAIKKRLIDAGFEVQTTRLALAPAYEWMSGLDTAKTVEAAREIEARANEAGIDYVSLGPVAEFGDMEDNEYEKLPELIASTRAIFASALLTSGLVNTGALASIAKAIKRIAAETENGFGTLRFAGLAECEPGIPFFPAAFAGEEWEFSCALAIECADLALDAANQFDDSLLAIRALSRGIEEHAARIETALQGTELETGAAFNGCDWSLAPHPDPSCSIGAALEKLTGAPFGDWGTLSGIATLTQAIRLANVRHVGFSGVFLPMLEDCVLARRTHDISDLQKLLLYCSVCGSGLDTIPLAGDVDVKSMEALLGDVATLALVLKKPLTARLMPIPGLKSGETTQFDFPYLVNGHTIPLNGGGTKLWKGTRGWGLTTCESEILA